MANEVATENSQNDSREVTKKCDSVQENLKEKPLNGYCNVEVNGCGDNPEGTTKVDNKDAEAVVEKGEMETSEKMNGEKKDEPEVVFIQDLGFTVKILSPGTEAIDIQVSSMELVQEIHQLLIDREETCHRTCFSLQLDGNTLDNFAELKSIEGLKEGSVIKVVEEPYTMREARIHVRHVRDLLKSLDSADAYNGLECASLSFLNVITQGDIVGRHSP